MAWNAANSGNARALARKPLLIVDETTAHITAVAEQAAQLFAWFRGEGIVCVLQRRAGPADLDVVNFGDPTRAEERCIRRAFARWQKHISRPMAVCLMNGRTTPSCRTPCSRLRPEFQPSRDNLVGEARTA